MRVGSRRKKSVAGTTIAAITTLASSRKASRHRIAAIAEGTRRRSSHCKTGTSATAMTSAIVSGRKNSAPAFNANGVARTSPAPAISVSADNRRSRRPATRIASSMGRPTAIPIASSPAIGAVRGGGI